MIVNTMAGMDHTSGLYQQVSLTITAHVIVSHEVADSLVEKLCRFCKGRFDTIELDTISIFTFASTFVGRHDEAAHIGETRMEHLELFGNLFPTGSEVLDLSGM